MKSEQRSSERVFREGLQRGSSERVFKASEKVFREGLQGMFRKIGGRSSELWTEMFEMFEMFENVLGSS